MFFISSYTLQLLPQGAVLHLVKEMDLSSYMVLPVVGLSPTFLVADILALVMC